MKRLTSVFAIFLFSCAGILFAAEDEPGLIASKAQILEHPVHPMLVVFPLGLFITALIFDLVYFRRKDVFWRKVAFFTMLIGFVGGLAAAIPGMIDYFYAIPTGSDPYHTATVHGVLNGIVILLFGVNLLVRWQRKDYASDAVGWTFLLSLIGVVIMLFSASLGGHMVYREGVGIKLEEEDSSARSEIERPATPEYLHYK